MGLNESRGNMYSDITHTWNVIKGKCEHDCEYCYMKRFKQNERRFDESELKTNLGRDNHIFVGSSNDMWSRSIPSDWIYSILLHCSDYPNKYRFQTKNPMRFLDFMDGLNDLHCEVGTTIETNRYNKVRSNAPPPTERADAIKCLQSEGFETFITIEPIYDFNLSELVGLIEYSAVDKVYIGADSNNNVIHSEPHKEDILELIDELEEFTEVIQKPNLGRLLK